MKYFDPLKGKIHLNKNENLYPTYFVFKRVVISFTQLAWLFIYCTPKSIVAELILPYIHCVELEITCLYFVKCSPYTECLSKSCIALKMCTILHEDPLCREFQDHVK